MPTGNSDNGASEHELDWRVQADDSLLRRAAENWMPDAPEWFEKAFSRLPETIRVNPSEWILKLLKAGLNLLGEFAIRGILVQALPDVALRSRRGNWRYKESSHCAP